MSAKAFNLFGKKFEVSEARNNYFKVKKFCKSLSAGAAAEFISVYKDKVSSAHEMVRKSEGIAIEIAGNRAERIISYLLDKKICNVTTDDIVNSILCDGSFEKHYNDCVYAYNDINDEADNKIEERREAKMERGRWEGGGFGVSGAIKGAAAAGAMNAASGIGYSVVNGIGNLVTEGERSSRLNNLYKNSDAIEAMANGLELDITNYFVALGEILEKEKKMEIKWIYQKESDEAQKIFENIEYAKSSEQKNSMIFDTLQKCPDFRESYVYIIKNCEKEEINTALKMADSFGVDIKDEIDEMFNLYLPKSISSQEYAEKVRENILNEMSYYGVNSCSALDVVDDKIYEFKLQSTLDKISRAESSEQLEKVKSEIDYSYFEKSKEIIDKAIKERNAELCTFMEILFISDVEKDKQKNLYEKFDQQISKCKNDNEVLTSEKEIDASDIHAELAKILHETAKEKLFLIEKDEYSELVKGDIFSLTLEEYNKIYPEINKDNFSQRLLDSVKEEVADAGQKIRCLRTVENFLGFYKINNIQPSSELAYLMILYIENIYPKKLNFTSEEIYVNLFDLYKELFLAKETEYKTQIQSEIKDKSFENDAKTIFDDNSLSFASENYNPEVHTELPILSIGSYGDDICFALTTHHVMIFHKNEKEKIIKLSDSFDAKYKPAKFVLKDKFIIDTDNGTEKISFSSGTGFEEFCSLMNSLVPKFNHNLKGYTSIDKVSSEMLFFLNSNNNIKIDKNNFIDYITEIFNSSALSKEAKDLIIISVLPILGKILEDLSLEEITPIYERYMAECGKLGVSISEIERLFNSRNSFMGNVYKSEKDLQKAHDTQGQIERITANIDENATPETILDCIVEIAQGDFDEKIQSEKITELGKLLFDKLSAVNSLDRISSLNAKISKSLNDFKTFNLDYIIQEGCEKEAVLETESRTYLSKVYASRKEMLEARSQDEGINHIIKSVDLNNIDEVAKAIDEISMFSNDIKSSYLIKLKETYNELERQQRTYLGVEYGSVDEIKEAQTELDEIKQYLMSVNRSNYDEVKLAYNKICACKYPLVDNYKKEFEGYINAFKSKICNVEGVIFETEDEADLARTELEQIKIIVTNINPNDEESILRAKEDIYAFKTAIKNKYIEETERIWRNYDLNARTWNGRVLNTREEVKIAQNEYEEMQELMKSLDQNDETALLQAKETVGKLNSFLRDEYSAIIDGALNQYDVNIRTVNGKLYDTREQAELFRHETDSVNEIMHSADPNDEASILEAKRRLLELQSEVKEAPLQQIDDMWNQYDLTQRTFENWVFDTREQASNARKTTFEFRNMVETMNLLDQSTVMLLENFVTYNIEEVIKSSVTTIVDEIKDINNSVAQVKQTDSTINPVTQKKESADLYKSVEKLISKMKKYNIDTSEMEAIMNKHYGSLNAGQKLFSFIKKKL